MKRWLLLPLDLLVFALDMFDMAEDAIDGFLEELAEACGRIR